MKLVIIGVLFGIAGAALVMPAMRSLLFGASPFNAAVFAAAVLILIAVALFASYLPARRATRRSDGRPSQRMTSWRGTTLAALAALLASNCGSDGAPATDAGSAPAAMVLDTIASGLSVPWAMAFAPDGRIFVTERPGRIRVIDHGALAPTPGRHSASTRAARRD